MKYKLIKDLKKGDMVDVHLGEGITEEAKSVGRWMPEFRREYWYVDDIGKVYLEDWNNDDVGNWRYMTGNCFRTGKQAEKYKEYLEFKAEFEEEWIRLNDGWEPNWGISKGKYCFYYDHDTRWWRVEHRLSWEDFNYFFKSKEATQSIIDKFGDKLHMLSPHWLLELYK
jgi:hypothetical protein